MICKVRAFWVFILSATLTGTVCAQELPSAPVPVVPSNSPAATAAGSTTTSQAPAQLPPAETFPAQPLPAQALTGPPALLPPPPPGPPDLSPPYQDRNGPLLRGDPWLDRPEAPPPGWFLGLELDVVGAHIKNRLQAPVTVDGTTIDPLHLPTADMDWTGAPRIELGYRFDQGWGEFL